MWRVWLLHDGKVESGRKGGHGRRQGQNMGGIEVKINLHLLLGVIGYQPLERCFVFSF